MKPQYSVQFEKPPTIEMLLEILRYADVLSINDEKKITVHCPAGIANPGHWAARNAERIRTFNLEANSHKKGN